MGLDAGVYRNLRGVSGTMLEQVRLDDPETGEINYKDSPDGTPDRINLYTARFRIGNVAMADWLREEVENRLPGGSLLLHAVLYSGSHSGDFIPLGQLNELEREVKLIQAGPEPLPAHLQEFLNKMSTLVDAARKEQNPIVFV